MQEFGVDLQTFREAYEFLRSHNAAYAHVTWDEEAARGLEVVPELGLPAVFGACVQLQGANAEPAENLRQEGPAEAVLGNSDSEDEAVVEKDEYCAGLADEDAKIDTDKQFAKVELALRKLEMQKAETLLHEQQVRSSGPSFSDYKSLAGREAIEQEEKKLHAEMLKLKLDKMKAELEAVLR